MSKRKKQKVTKKNFIHVEGWEDGEPFSKELDGIDRWTTQMADTLRVDVDDNISIKLVQDPHSPHLGGYIWDTSIIMCKYFSSLPKTTFVGKRWVELGSGIGFMGLVIEKLGADIVITDIPELVPVMQKNIELNKCSRAKARSLYWGKDAETVKDLSNPPPDYLMICDCVYSEANVLLLVEVMQQVCGPDTIVYSASELRNVDVWETFITQASEVFECTKLQKEELPNMDGVENINVYTMKKKPA